MTTAPTTQGEVGAVCPVCQEPVEMHWDLCLHCGNWLPPEPNLPFDEARRSGQEVNGGR